MNNTATAPVQSKKNKGGRPSKLTPELLDDICRYLRNGISITALCGALGIPERRYYRWAKSNPEFRHETTRARERGKIGICFQILQDKDWRAKAWYLERCWPSEFGRCADRRLPDSAPEAPQSIPVSFVLSLPDGTKEPITFDQAEKRYCNFPRRDYLLENEQSVVDGDTVSDRETEPDDDGA